MTSPPDPETQLNQKLARLFATIAARDAQARREYQDSRITRERLWWAENGQDDDTSTTNPQTL